MANLRVRFRFNPGGNGAPLDRLGNFTVQTEKFLRSLARDLGLPIERGSWLANNFSNESVAFDSEYADFVAEPIAMKGSRALDLLTGPNPLEACDRRFVGFKTAIEFAQLGKGLEPHEQFLIGIYADSDEIDWRPVTYSHVRELERQLDTPIVSYGSIQGTMHSWASGAETPFFQLRDLASGDLVRCNYGPKLREKVHHAHKQEKTVIHVYGDISWSRSKDTIIDVNVTDIEQTKPLSDEAFDRLFGSMPNFTDDLSAE